MRERVPPCRLGVTFRVRQRLLPRFGVLRRPTPGYPYAVQTRRRRLKRLYDGASSQAATQAAYRFVRAAQGLIVIPGFRCVPVSSRVMARQARRYVRAKRAATRKGAHLSVRDHRPAKVKAGRHCGRTTAAQMVHHACREGDVRVRPGSKGELRCADAHRLARRKLQRLQCEALWLARAQQRRRRLRLKPQPEANP